MNESKTETKDPICGMTVDEATALHAERNGKTFYFCGDHCRNKFLSTPAGAEPEEKAGAAVDNARTLPRPLQQMDASWRAANSL